MTQDKQQDKKKPGPVPEHLKIEGMDWEDAMEKALKKKRPKEGWPEDSKADKKKNDTELE